MKQFQIGWVFILAIVFSACGPHYNSEPSQRILKQQGHFVLLHPGDKEQTLVFDSAYVMSPTWWQAKQWAKDDGSYPWFWILAILGPAAGIGAGKWATRKQAARPWVFFMVLIVWAVFWVAAYCVLDSKRWSSDQEVPKSVVDSVMSKDGDTHAIWEKYKPL